MSHSQVCPYCEKETLNVFQKTPAIHTLTCKGCKATFAYKTSWGIVQETILPWMSFLTGIIALFAFFGIKCIDDLKNKRAV